MLLHANGLIHTDVKPENLIIDDINVTPIDLGSAIHCNKDQSEIRLERFRRGTISYVAPELTKSLYPPYTFAIDYYSCGLLLRQFLYPVYCQVGAPQNVFLLFLSNPTEMVYSLHGVKPEHYLAEHFTRGIINIYGPEVAQIVNSLLDPNPSSRSNITSTFIRLSTLHPKLAEKVFELKLAFYQTRLLNIQTRFPEAAILVNKCLPKLNNLFDVKYDFGNPCSLNTGINNLYRVQCLNKFLQLYYLCNGVLPDLTYTSLEYTLVDLFESQDKLLSSYIGIYYDNREINHKLEFYQKFKLNALNLYVDTARLLVARNLATADNPVVKELIDLQSLLHHQWNTGCSLQTILQYSKHGLEMTYKLAVDDKGILDQLHTIFDPLIHEAEYEILTRHSPKLPRIKF
jgi:serine/threonine protein kinase